MGKLLACASKRGYLYRDDSWNALPGESIMAVLVTQLKAVEEAHDSLGLSYKQVASTLGADESTLHRWRSGDTEPSPAYITRLGALEEFIEELFGTLRSEGARAWLEAEVPSLDGRRPIDLLLEGCIEPLTRILLRMNLGVSL